MSHSRLEQVAAARCRDELARLNGNYAICFDWMHEPLGYDCTAPQLSETLKRNGYSWAPSERAARRWKAEIRPVIRRYQDASTDTLKRR